MKKTFINILTSRLYFGIFIILILALISINEIITFHKTEKERLHNNFGNLSNSLECRLSSSFQGAENALAHLKQRYESGITMPDLQQLMKSYHSMDNSLFMMVSLFDASGRITLSNLDEQLTGSVDDREFYMYHKEHNDAFIYIDSPAWGRFHDTPYIPISIRVNDKNGQFAGAIMVAVDTHYVSGIFGSLHFDFDYLIYLADSMGRVYNGIEYVNHHSNVFEEYGKIIASDTNANIDDTFYEIHKSISLNKDRYIYKKRTALRANINPDKYTIFIVFEIFWDHQFKAAKLYALKITLVFLLTTALILLFLYYSNKKDSEKDQHFQLMNLQRDKLNNMLYASGIATWEWNLQTDEIIINQNYAELYGYTLKELTPMKMQTWYNMVLPEDSEKVSQLYNDHISGAAPTYEYECRVKQKKGDIIWIHAKGKVVFWDKDGKPLWLYGIHQNVTEIKNTQEAYNQNQKLESVGVLAGGIAHEFNNILSGVYGYIELAMLRVQDEKVKHFLKSSVSSIDKAKILSRKLITFSEGGKLDIIPQQIEYYLRNSITTMIKNKAYSISFHNLIDLWPVFYDKTQIFNVLSNIVQNAMEAMPDGGHIGISAKNIYIATHKVLTPGDYVQISVSDEGEGINTDATFRLFDPFFTTKTSKQGLGLTVCFSILKKHNGHIEFEPNNGKGSIFHFFLPADRETSHNAEKREATAENKMGKILLLEDDDASRDMFVQLLSILGYDILISYNPEQTMYLLQKYTEEEVKGIIIDLESIKSTQSRGLIYLIRSVREDTPVFLTSNHVKDPMMQNPKKYFFTDSIPKPFTLLDLESKIQLL